MIWPLLLVADTATDPTATITTAFVQLGAVGALALILLWFSLGAYKDVKAQREQERARAERAEAELRVLNADLTNKYVPVLTDAVRILGDVTALMRERKQ